MREPLKLSEAMRLGAMWKPQGFDALLWHGKTCALGAALDAVGALPQQDEPWGLPNDPVPSLWPFILNPQTCPCAECKEDPYRYTIGSVITHLNDQHKWTREQIADFIATIEPQDSAHSQPADLAETRA